jgi:hypothetical protein
MNTFVCTFADDTAVANVIGEKISIKERIRQMASGICGAYVDEDFTSGSDRIMQVRCTSAEAALFMKLAFADFPQVHVAEFRVTVHPLPTIQ